MVTEHPAELYSSFPLALCLTHDNVYIFQCHYLRLSHALLPQLHPLVFLYHLADIYRASPMHQAGPVLGLKDTDE